MYSILAVIDDDQILQQVTDSLSSESRAVSTFRKADDALLQCAVRQFDLILTGQRLPGTTGIELLTHFAANHPDTRRVMISTRADFDEVTLAFSRSMIHQFVLHPWKPAELRSVIEEELAARGARQETGAGAEKHRATGGTDRTASAGIITRNKTMLELLDLVAKTAGSEAAFFIQGETGTGKELVAQAIHQDSGRQDHPFLALNCANLSSTLLESQLFGHRRGAFTGAHHDQEGMLSAANGGTLFLDEVVEIPLPLQAKLLRVLQEKEYTPIGETQPHPFDAKIISASSISLEQASREGRFRDDLRFRLEVMPIALPPLKKRSEDIEPLFSFYLQQQFERHDQPVKPVEPEVYDLLLAHHWPGNVRELINVCIYIAALTAETDPSISTEKLPLSIRSPAASRHSVHSNKEGGVFRPTITRQSLQQAMLEFGGRRDRMAAYFGISRMTLWRRMKRFGLL